MDARRRPFYRSIRFRLTAWYALLLIGVLAAVGIALSTLVERGLREDVDARLLTTARNILNEIRVQPGYQRGMVVGIEIPRLDPLASPGQVVQIVDAQGRVRATTGVSDGSPLPAIPLTSDSRTPAFLTSTANGITVRTVRIPMITERDDVLIGAIVVGESQEPLERTLGLLKQLMLTGGAAGVVLAALGGWFLAGRALKPVARITATAAAIAADAESSRSLATRLTVPDTGDELARLAQTFNRMLDRLEQTFSGQRRFIADASHELRTPLTAIRGNIDVMLRQVSAHGAPAEDLAAALEDLRRESARMGRLVEDLLTLARSEATPDDPRRRRPVRLDLIARDAVRTTAALAVGQRLEVVAPSPVTIVADRDRITQLLINLLDNAIRHTPADGEITVTVGAHGTTARLAVRDNGCGIAPEHLPHVFDRFYRTEAARDRATGNTGLGLAIARAIARAHAGDIEVASSIGQGTVFTITLPVAPVQVVEAGTPAAVAS